MRPKWYLTIYTKNKGLFAEFNCYIFNPEKGGLEDNGWFQDPQRITDKNIRRVFKRDEDEALFRLNKIEYLQVCRSLQRMVDHYKQNYSIPPQLQKIASGITETSIPSLEFLVDFSILRATHRSLMGWFTEIAKRPLPSLPKSITFMDDIKEKSILANSEERLSAHAKREKVLNAYIELCELSNTVRPKQIEISDKTGMTSADINRVMKEAAFYVDLQKVVEKKAHQAKTSSKRELWGKVMEDIQDLQDKLLDKIRKNRNRGLRETDGITANDRKRGGKPFVDPQDYEMNEDIP